MIFCIIGSLVYIISLGQYYIDFQYWFLLGIDSEIIENIIFLQIIVLKMYFPILMGHVVLILLTVSILQLLSGCYTQEKENFIFFICIIILLEGLKGNGYLQLVQKNIVDVYSFDKIYFLKWCLLIFYVMIVRVFVYHTPIISGLLVVLSILDLTAMFKPLFHYKRLLMRIF